MLLAKLCSSPARWALSFSGLTSTPNVRLSLYSHQLGGTAKPIAERLFSEGINDDQCGKCTRSLHNKSRMGRRCNAKINQLLCAEVTLCRSSSFAGAAATEILPANDRSADFLPGYLCCLFEQIRTRWGGGSFFGLPAIALPCFLQNYLNFSRKNLEISRYTLTSGSDLGFSAIPAKCDTRSFTSTFSYFFRFLYFTLTFIFSFYIFLFRLLLKIL